MAYKGASWQETAVGCRQKISFGVMSTKEVINTAELHVYERPLYSVSLSCERLLLLIRGIQYILAGMHDHE